ncbi:nicotinate-nucleotide adenylyltransferase [bacterium]|nr:nicotinate-nucleotide adenylyltransferase [bacterium]
MKLCVFQGTFNPIHKAHLRVAQDVISHYDFDKIIFIPAYNPPHKNADLDFSKHRLKMVQLAVKINPRFEVSDIEFKREGKSYTILTIKELYSLYEVEGKIHFIIGTDAFEKIETWYQVDELKQLVKFIVFVREDNFDISRYDYLKSKGFDFEFQTLPYADISSTELRNKIKNDESIDDYVAQEVKEYIIANGLYKN